MTTKQRLPIRSFGRTGIKVSEIGFGAWGIGKSMWGPTDDTESKRALKLALDLGVNFFDTAFAYGHGHSEKLIGETIRSLETKPVVATNVPPKNMEWPAHAKSLLGHTFPPDWVRTCTETSLRNLRLERLDLQQLHVWSDHWLEDKRWPETAAMVESLKKEGKIRFFGVSVNSDDPDTCMEIVRSGAVDSVQVILNLFDQRPLDGLLALCAQKKTAVIVRCPFDEGGLAGSLTPKSKFEPGDFRNHYFGGERLAETCRRAAAIEKILVPKHANSLADAALKFCLSFPAVSTVIPGMRTTGHVEANVRAADGRYLSSKLLDELKSHAWIRNFY